MKRTAVILLVLAGVAVAAWWRPMASSESPVTPAAQTGYRVQIDPASGQFTDEVAPVDPDKLPAALRNALSTSSEGLSVRQSPVPGGGQMIDLQGRFQNTSVARVKDDGSLEAPCLTNEKALETFSSDDGKGE